MKRAAPQLKVGAKIGDDLTVLGVIDKQMRNPVYIVWHHRAWCPMACKVFATRHKAEREAAALSALAHPNTVRFFSVGAPPHMLMEFLEGPTLRRLIEKQPHGRLSVANALRVAIHLGAALHHVHARGYVHLDVKPHNVIVVHGRPVLFDFGSARRLDLPRPMHVSGTDPYIAPEECLMREITPAADVFGLGVTLYESLTGMRPFPQGTPRKPFPQTEKRPTPLGVHRPSLPAALEELVLACLVVDPGERPSLPVLLPALHDHVKSGPPMWPPGFRPG
jgi:serine/threonine protein kinase